MIRIIRKGKVMSQKFNDWLKNRDIKLVKDIAANEGFTDWVRKNPFLYKSIFAKVNNGNINHGAKNRSPLEQTPSHEDYGGEAEISLMFQYIGENLKERLEAIAVKWKKDPYDPGFKRWLLRLFKKLANINYTLTPDILKEVPNQIGELLYTIVDREFNKVKHVFSELPEHEMDYDFASNLNRKQDRVRELNTYFNKKDIGGN